MAPSHLVAALLSVVAALGPCGTNARSIPTLLRQPLHQNATKYLPIVIWHGMGDSCCDERSIGAVALHIRALLPGTFVHSISTAVKPGDEESDVWSSYFGNANDQVEAVCRELAALPALQGRYIGVGFSQGGQFLRAVVQRCQHRGPRMHSLVTLGSQHQGVMDVPGCWAPSFNSTPSWGCQVMQRVLGYGAYLPWIQAKVIQAQYYKDPAELEVYQQRSLFLADINGESALGPLPPHYRTNLVSLQRLVLFVFDNDVTVVPKESAHFGFYDGQRLLSMQETDLYRDDRIGLQQLDSQGRVLLEHAPGFHMQFTLEWFGDHVVYPYLAVPAAEAARKTAAATATAAAAAA